MGNGPVGQYSYFYHILSVDVRVDMFTVTEQKKHLPYFLKCTKSKCNHCKGPISSSKCVMMTMHGLAIPVNEHIHDSTDCSLNNKFSRTGGIIRESLRCNKRYYCL